MESLPHGPYLCHKNKSNKVKITELYNSFSLITKLNCKLVTGRYLEISQCLQTKWHTSKQLINQRENQSLFKNYFELCASFPGDSASNESACNAGDPGSVPGLGRSSGEGNSNPLQHSCLGNPIDRGTWQATVHGVSRVGYNFATKPSPPPKATYKVCRSYDRVWDTVPTYRGGGGRAVGGTVSPHPQAILGYQQDVWGFNSVQILPIWK